MREQTSKKTSRVTDTHLHERQAKKITVPSSLTHIRFFSRLKQFFFSLRIFSSQLPLSLLMRSIFPLFSSACSLAYKHTYRICTCTGCNEQTPIHARERDARHGGDGTRRETRPERRTPACTFAACIRSHVKDSA